jgi:hypothetical protein
VVVHEEEYQQHLVIQKYGKVGFKGRPSMPSGKYIINGKPVYEKDYCKLASTIIVADEEIKKRKEYIKQLLMKHLEIRPTSS